MSIRFPKWCKSRRQRSEYAKAVALKGWEKRRAERPKPVWIGGVTFRGPFAAGAEMTLDLYAVEGERKWTGMSEGKILSNRFSERTVLKLVREVLRRRRF